MCISDRYRDEDDWVRFSLQKVSDSGCSYIDSEWRNLIAIGDAI